MRRGAPKTMPTMIDSRNGRAKVQFSWGTGRQAGREGDTPVRFQLHN